MGTSTYKWQVLLQAGCLSYHILVLAMNETKSTDPNQWPGLILPSFISGLLVGGALVRLQQRSFSLWYQYQHCSLHNLRIFTANYSHSYLRYLKHDQTIPMISNSNMNWIIAITCLNLMMHHKHYMHSAQGALASQYLFTGHSALHFLIAYHFQSTQPRYHIRHSQSMVYLFSQTFICKEKSRKNHNTF